MPAATSALQQWPNQLKKNDSILHLKNEWKINLVSCVIPHPRNSGKSKTMFSTINDLVFVKKRRGQSWLDVSFWYAGVVLILLLQTAPLEIQGACSCDSSVPPCQNTVSSSSNGTTALSSCNKVARDDCPCCFVCAGQLGDTCSQAQPCDPSHSLVCKEKGCQKGKKTTKQVQINGQG